MTLSRGQSAAPLPAPERSDLSVIMKRSSFIRALLLTALLGLAAMPAAAQTGVDVTRPLLGVPTNGALQALGDVPRFLVPAPAVDRLIAEDRWWINLGMPARFAAPHEVTISPWTHGVWESIGDGRQLWRLRIASPGALSLNLGFSHFALPSGARLHVFSLADGTEVGPFTRQDMDVHGELWTPPLASDELLLAIVVPSIRQHRVDLVLRFINHGYAGFGEPAPKSGGCNVDLGCEAATPWQERARAVGLISVAGTYYCSAFLVNNTAQDQRPLLLTARHCGVHAGNAASVVVLWNHDRGGCRDESSNLRDDAGRVRPQSDQGRSFQSGARWLADDLVTDFSLLDLDDPVDARLGLFFAGWDRRDREPRSSVVIHHPNTDAKRISFDSDPAAISAHFDAERYGNGSHLRVGGWELGTTEGGSSGAPLFNESGRVVGLLHGGLAACGNHQPDWFGRLAAAWEGGGAANSRLRDWLDPLGTGVEILDGLRGSSPQLADAP